MPDTVEGWVGDPVTSVDDLEDVLAGAALLGLELDTRYRVLAATLEPTADRYAWGSGGAVADRRVQLLVSPVSTMLASFRRRTGDRVEVLAFTEEHLVDVASAMDGAPVEGPLFGRPEPRPGQWAPEWSLQGRSAAPDGTARTLTLSARHDDAAGELALDVFARFDELQVRDPAGADLVVIGPPSVFGGG